MIVPNFLIVPFYFGAFALFGWTFYVKKTTKLTESGFLLACLSLAIVIVYVLLVAFDDAWRAYSPLACVVGLVLFGTSIWRLRQSEPPF